MKRYKSALLLAFSLAAFIAIGELRAHGNLSFWQAIFLGGLTGGLLPFIFRRNKDPLSRN